MQEVVISLGLTLLGSLPDLPQEGAGKARGGVEWDGPGNILISILYISNEVIGFLETITGIDTHLQIMGGKKMCFLYGN